VAWSSDGTKVVSASYDATIRIWDTATGDCEKILKEGRSSFPPKDFEAAETLNNCLKDLSQRAPRSEPVGIECKEVYVVGETTRAWIGDSLVFFRLIDIDGKVPTDIYEKVPTKRRRKWWWWWVEWDVSMSCLYIIIIIIIHNK
jgi:hypothetical protein